MRYRMHSELLKAIYRNKCKCGQDNGQVVNEGYFPYLTNCPVGYIDELAYNLGEGEVVLFDKNATKEDNFSSISVSNNGTEGSAILLYDVLPIDISDFDRVIAQFDAGDGHLTEMSLSVNSFNGNKNWRQITINNEQFYAKVDDNGEIDSK